LRPAGSTAPHKEAFPEVLQTIRRLLIRPGRFRLERELPGGICTHVINAPCQGAPNNEAERALRHAVIARRLSFGTRTEEGSAAYSAVLSVVETCRRRKLDPWSYIADVLARARTDLRHQPVPVAA